MTDDLDDNGHNWVSAGEMVTDYWRARAESAEAENARLREALDWAYSGDGLDECAIKIESAQYTFRMAEKPSIQVGVRMVIEAIRARAALKGGDDEQ